MKRQTITRQAVVAACALALVGTSIGSMGARHDASAASAHSRRAALSGTLSVFDWGAFGGSGAPAVGKAQIAAYQRLHPGVKIKIVSLPPGDPTVYEESVLAAGTAPDVLSPSYTQQVFSDLPKHTWLDLTAYLQQPDPYIKGNKHWIDSMVPAINAQNSFEGSHYYVISWSAQDAMFFYNKDIFKKAGIAQPPTTWAELLADSARIKKAGYIPNQYFLGDTYPIGENGSFVSLLENQVMQKTFRRLDTNHDGIVDIKELVYGIKHHIYSPMNADYQAAWTLYRQWSQYWQPNAAGNKGPYNASEAVADQTFFQGKSAMAYRATGFLNNLVQTKPKFQWGFFKMPEVTTTSTPLATPNDGVGIWGAWNGIAWGIPASTVKQGHLALALDFLHYITAPQNEVPEDLAMGYLPVTTGFTPDGAYNTAVYYLLKHPTMQFAAEATLGPEWLKERIATQQNYILGMESLQQAMADMQRYTDQAADQMIKLYHLSD